MDAQEIQNEQRTHCGDCEGLLWDCDMCGKSSCADCDGHVARDVDGCPVAFGCGACCTDADCRRDKVHAEVAHA